MVRGTEIEEFWQECRRSVAGLPESAPPAWSFGRHPAEAEALLALVLAGVKTATSSALDEYEREREPIPRAGDLGIVLDGSGHPSVLLRTTAVAIVPFAQVPASHAFDEGEGDRSLASWREIHRDFWGGDLRNGGRFDDGMLVVCERFEVLHRRSR